MFDKVHGTGEEKSELAKKTSVLDVTVKMFDVEALVEEIIAGGATRARVIGTGEIVIDPRVRLKCQVPRCGSYGHNLQCPPHCLTVKEFRDYLACYRRAILLQLEGELPAENVQGQEAAGGPGIVQDREAVYRPANELHRLVNWAESRAFALGFRFAAGFIGGCCKLCPECVGPGQKCCHPFLARPSMEAVGVDVVATSRKAGMPIAFPVKDKVVWCGLLLLD